MEISEILNVIGEGYWNIFGKLLSTIPSEFLVNPLTAKILSILFALLIILTLIKFVNTIKPIVKWSIVLIFILLIISVISTFA